MTATLQRWGNSLGLRLPRPLLNQLGLREGTEVDIRVDGERLVITRASPCPSLRELMAGITPEDRPEELEWGPPTGKEAW
jgi:antitoxin MazE